MFCFINLIILFPPGLLSVYALVPVTFFSVLNVVILILVFVC